jgi:hypothetical protein
VNHLSIRRVRVLTGKVRAGVAYSARSDEFIGSLQRLAGAPYTNVDHRNRGNDTGDSQIEKLNQGQLDQNYWRNAQRPGGVPNQPYYPPR